MKTYYMVTYDGEPVTDIIIDNEEVIIFTDEDCKPILFDMKDTAVKMCIALSWMLKDWDFGWERIYV